MRMIGAASLVAVCGMLAVAPAQAQWVSSFKGNDTGGIIAYSLMAQTDIRSLAIDHCASYGKVVKFLAVEPHDGGYISFACRWVPYGMAARPLRTYYWTGPSHYRPILDRSILGSEIDRERGAWRDSTTTIEAKWLGACKADQKPGDIVMPGGFKMNIKDADKLRALAPK